MLIPPVRGQETAAARRFEATVGVRLAFLAMRVGRGSANFSIWTLYLVHQVKGCPNFQIHDKLDLDPLSYW